MNEEGGIGRKRQKTTIDWRGLLGVVYKTLCINGWVLRWAYMDDRMRMYDSVTYKIIKSILHCFSFENDMKQEYCHFSHI